MSKILLIVESPNKAKHIAHMLSDDYIVKASGGHIRDLPRHEMGIDLTSGKFGLTYVPIEREGGFNPIKSLQSLARTARKTILATDPDQEGEAISWHLMKVLDLKDPERVRFGEITETAIKNALANPDKIDFKRVAAQETRRALDRLIGYTVSPLLSSILQRRSLSGGRVQSVVLLLICDRQKLIENFTPINHYSVNAFFENKENSTDWKATWNTKKWLDGSDCDYVLDKETAEKVATIAEYVVTHCADKEESKNPPAAFTTSTYQQYTTRRFKLSSDKVMAIAQKLFEDGYITYHRTDSLNVSKEGFEEICKALASANLPHLNTPRTWKEKESSQVGHECLRPTFDKDPDKNPDNLSGINREIYDAIYNRALASQMPAATYMRRTIKLESTDTITAPKPVAQGITIDPNAIETITKKIELTSTSAECLSKGYKALLEDDDDDKSKEDAITLPKLPVGQKISPKNTAIEEKTTSPPKPFTESSIIQTMENLGIGRPSTYAATLSRLTQKEYVVRDGQTLVATDIGFEIVRVLRSDMSFMDPKYTAMMEARLDSIAKGDDTYLNVISSSYKTLTEETKKLEKDTIGSKQCPKCGSPMVLRHSKKTGNEFWGCTRYNQTPSCDGIVSSDRTVKQFKGAAGVPKRKSGSRPVKAGARSTTSRGRRK